MKRIAVLFFVSFLAAGVLMLSGSIMIRKNNVSVEDVYNVVKQNIQIGETNVDFQKAELTEITDQTAFTTEKNVSYPLNEFNTVQIFAESCSAKIIPAKSDEMSISIDVPSDLSHNCFLKTFVKNGSLYITDIKTGDSIDTKNVTITVEIPENYKGGYFFAGNFSQIDVCDIESSMDISFNLTSSSVSAGTLEAGSIVLEMSGSAFSAERLYSRGNFDVSSISSEIVLNNLNMVYSKLAANSSTVKLNNISGGINADLQTTSAQLNFYAIKGNVIGTAESSSLKITFPHDSPVSLRHEEKYSAFNDDVEWTDSGQKNQNSRYIIDTNVNLSIVTLAEKV
ncbi:MAG: hypothetical protein II685_04950 [Clostridia bacterium]|nr:hypothetical protein [Clostridia bacterium]